MSVFDFSLFARGGPMMGVLLAMGIIAAVMFVERTLYLHRGQIRSTAFINGIKNILAKRRLVEALTVCEETPGPVAAVVKAALLHADAAPSMMRFYVQEAAVVEIPALERRLGSIAAIAQAAPMVGLLGTILGMIATFYAFERTTRRPARSRRACGRPCWRRGQPHAGDSGQPGLPFLSSRVRAIVRDVEWAGNEIMKYLLTDYREPPAAGVRPRGLRPRHDHPPPRSCLPAPPEPRNFDALFYVNVGFGRAVFHPFRLAVCAVARNSTARDSPGGRGAARFRAETVFGCVDRVRSYRRTDSSLGPAASWLKARRGCPSTRLC